MMQELPRRSAAAQPASGAMPWGQVHHDSDYFFSGDERGMSADLGG
jgi:hypothetical protein